MPPIEFVPMGFSTIQGGYSPKTEVQSMDIEFIDGGYKVRFDITGVCKEGKFRVDPLEGRECGIELINVVSDCSICRIQSNALIIDEKKYYFDTIDPIFEFEGEFDNATYIEIEYKIFPLITKEMFKLIKNQKERNNNLCQELSCIKNSRGYRLLEKIKKIKSFCKG